MICVLIVDDMASSRQLMSHILSRDGEFHVVGQACDGLQAVAMAKKLRPDLILMDINMPQMDGFEATREIMTERPTPIVLISGSTAVHEVETGMRALHAGALTLRMKPPGPNSPGFEAAAEELLDTAKLMSEVKVVRRLRQEKHAETGKVRSKTVAGLEQQAAALKVCAIATSTGGPPALQKLLSRLPPDFSLPILVVQHIAAGFTRGFATWLNSAVPLRVKLAEAGESLQPGTVYIAPEDGHLTLSRMGRILISEDAPCGGFRPSGTILFRSAAQAFGQGVLAMILTGMGRDGVAGLHDVRREGGTILAQDEASCVVFGMPRAAIAAGLPDRVLSLEAIPRAMIELVTTKARRES